MINSAGCIFSNGSVILSGWQQKNNKYIISGIGGNCIGNELIETTAIRETIEELFNVDNVDNNLIQEIITNVCPNQIIINGTYGILVYDFDHLEKILAIINKYNLHSDLYQNFPQTINDLIFKRINNTKAEIQTLCLLPVNREIVLDKYFLLDIQILCDLITKKTN